MEPPLCNWNLCMVGILQADFSIFVDSEMYFLKRKGKKTTQKSVSIPGSVEKTKHIDFLVGKQISQHL